MNIWSVFIINVLYYYTYWKKFQNGILKLKKCTVTLLYGQQKRVWEIADTLGQNIWNKKKCPTYHYVNNITYNSDLMKYQCKIFFFLYLKEVEWIMGTKGIASDQQLTQCWLR